MMYKERSHFERVWDSWFEMWHLETAKLSSRGKIYFYCDGSINIIYFNKNMNTFKILSIISGNVLEINLEVRIRTTVIKMGNHMILVVPCVPYTR